MASRTAEAARVLGTALTDHPEIAVVCGSGLGAVAEALETQSRIAYRDIPHWPAPSVPGHAGELVIGRLGGRYAVIARGRAHLYEGRSPDEVGFPVRVLASLGARTLIVTSAAGSLAPDLGPGDVMVISDHIALPLLAGWSPLRRLLDAEHGPRFTVMAGAYDAALQAIALEHLAGAGLLARLGVYAMVAGPAYETPAEARALRALGADAVGMSVAPEVQVARRAGMLVCGLSVITNRVVSLASNRSTLEPAGDFHAEVMSIGERVAPALGQAIAEIARRLPG